MAITSSVLWRTGMAVLFLAALVILFIAPGAMSAQGTESDEATQEPVWSADMLVVEYSSVSIGAASADLFSNIEGNASLQIKSLWSYIPGRDLRLAFTDGVPSAADYTLHVGDLTLQFPEDSSGDTSFKWTDVDVDWEDGQTIPVSIVQTAPLVEPAANTPAAGAPTTTGIAQVDQTLTANTSSITDEDGLTSVSYSYQWTRSDGSTYADIAGETDSTYILVFADQGKTIKVRVSFTDDADNEETLTSQATEEVTAAPNRGATGEPTINGTPKVDQTLTADTSDIADEDGLDGVSYNYQWMADDVKIDGATGSTYVPANGDAGKAIKVSVSFTDDRNNAEARTSAPTATIAAIVPTQPLSLTVATGDEIQELDASWQAPSSNGGSAVTGYRVQWKEAAESWDTEDDVSQSTVTGTTHTITGLTGGVEYAVRVIATNTAGDGPASAEAAGTPAGATSQQQTGDSTSPTVSSIAITSDPGSDEVYAIGDAIQITVTFSADVTVTGKPQLELDIGGNAKPAEYQSTNASSTVFSYTVTEGDSDTDGIAVAENKLTLNGGSIKDADDSAANLAHSALPAQTSHKVDGVRPTISSINLGGSKTPNLFILDEVMGVSVLFTEEIFLDGSPYITLDVDSGPQVASFERIRLPCPDLDASTSTATLALSVPEGEDPPPGVIHCFRSDTHGISMSFNYTVAKGDLDADGLGIAANALSLNGGTLRDAAGNDAVITHEAIEDSAAHVIDGVPPEITSIEIISDPGEDDTYAAGDTIQLNITFSERLEIDFGTPRLRLDIGGKTRMAYRVQRAVLDIQADETGYIMAYAYTVADGDNDEDGISIPANAVHRLWADVKDTNGNDAIFEHEAIADDAEHKVATATAAADDTQKTGLLMISGTLNVGETVNADFSNVTDEDGVEYAATTAYYHWTREGGGLQFLARSDPRYVIAAADEGKKLRVNVEFFDDNGNKEYLRSPWTEPVGPRAPSNSDPTGTPQVDQTLHVAAPDPEAYVTVVITSSDDTVSWSDPDECASDYNTYLEIFSSNERSRTHIGSVTSGSTEATQTISYTWTGNSLTPPSVEVELYCGTFDASSSENDLIASTYVAMWRSSLKEGTYSSAPLTALSISSGTLSPAFDRGINTYTAEVPNDVEVITLDPTVLTGYQTDFVRNPIWGVVAVCGRGCSYGYGNGATTGIVLADADDETEGFQIDLNRGENRLGLGVNKGNVRAGPGRLYYLTVTVENSPATGQPTINGTAQVGQTLTVDTSGISDADGLDNVSYSYQWLSSRDTEIEGATSSTYEVQSSDNGKLIKVRVTFTDDAGYDESLTSEATVAVTATVPSAPQSLTVTSGSQIQELDVSWQAPSSNGDSAVTGYKVQWKESTDSWDTAADVSEATETGTTHTITSLTGGVEYAVRVIATNVAGDGPASTEARATPADSPASGEEGTETVESDSTAAWTATLTVGVSGSGSEKVWGYNWFLDDMGTLDERTFNEGDQTIEVMGVLLSNGFVAFNVRPHPSHDFVLMVDGTQFASADASEVKSPTMISYIWPTTLEWAEDDTVVLSLTLKDTDSTETSGTPQQAAIWSTTLTVGVTETFAGYTTFLPDSTVLGALSSDTITLDDASHTVKALGVLNGKLILSVMPKLSTEFVLVAGTDEFTSTDASTRESTSVLQYQWDGSGLNWSEGESIEIRLTAPKQNTPASGAPVITGTVQVGETLTANTSGITDEDGLTNVSYGYQWLADDTNIDGATDSSYTLADAEENKTIKVKVTFTDDEGNHESLTSGATGEVAAKANSEPTGLPTISGTAEFGERLTADTSGIADENGMDNVEFSYQWIRVDDDTETEIKYAAASTYTPGVKDIHKKVKVEVTFTDEDGHEESLTSKQVGPVSFRVYADSVQKIVEQSSGEHISNLPREFWSATMTAASIEDTHVGFHSGENPAGSLDDPTFTYVPGDDYDYTVNLVVLDDDYLSVRFSGSIYLSSADLSQWTLSVNGQEFRVDEAVRDNDILGHPAKKAGMRFHKWFWDGIRNGKFDYSRDFYEEQLEYWNRKPVRGWQWPRGDLSFSDGDTVNLSLKDTTPPSFGDFLTFVPSLFPIGFALHSHPEYLDQVNLPSPSDFTITSDDTVVTIGEVLPFGGDFIWLGQLSPAIKQGQTVTLSYTDPTSADDVNAFQDLFGNDAADFTFTVTNFSLLQTDISQSSATGAPTINGTAQVGQVLTAETSGIADENGLTVVEYSYQWLFDDGAEIEGATDSTYTLQETDVGKAVKVKVSFRDDVAYKESLTSIATVAVAATVPTAPLSLTVTPGDQIQELDVSWQAPSSNGGSDITGYKVQWKEAAHSWDTAADVSEATVTGTSHTITSLTGGVEYTVRVIASNVAGDGPPSAEVKGTPAGGVSEQQAIDPANSAPTGLPSISGAPQVDQTLTANTSPIDDEDGLTNATFEYQWTAGGTDIDGATGSSYLLTPSEEGQTIQVRVTFTDDRNNAETLTSVATVEVTAVPVSLTASFLAAPSSHDGDNSFTFELRLSEEVDLSYVTLRDHDAFSVTDGEVTGASRLDKPGNLRWQIVVEPDADADVTIVLSSTTDCGAQGAICTGGGKKLSGRVELTVNGPEQQNNSATGLPTISGTPQVEETLTADTANIADQDGLTGVSYRYQWIAGGADISGATGSSHTLTAAEEGQTIQVRVTFTDDAGNAESLTSAATVAVAAAPNRDATGKPAIGGTPQVEQTLTADTSAIDDADGLTNVSYEYQWTADGTDIDGATGSSYTLTASEQGQTIQVRVSFTDDADNEETLTSAETLAVAAKPNTAAAGEPTISGTPQVEQTLTADTSGISDANGLNNVSYQYQWLRDDTEIVGQTNASYNLVSADEGKTIKVRVTFNDDAGNAESLTSTATTAVAAQPAETPVDLLTASFANVPADHNGGNFTFDLTFSENVEAGYARIQNDAFTVSGGSIASASRITQGSNQGWNVEVNPTGNGAVTITLPETTDCDATGAICTDDSRKLSHPTSATVAGPPAISIDDATVQEAEGATLVFTATLSHASSRTVTVDYATSDGTAQAGSDYTAASGTLTFNAGDTSQTVQVTVLTDSEDEGQEALTLTLSNPSQATLDDATGAGAIENGESSSGTQEDPPVVLLTGSFSNMPATHNGSAFTFDLSFSENVKAGYARIRDHAFTISGTSTIASAVRKTQGSNQNWTITVQPGGNEDIVITLPSTTNCSSQSGICTYDDRMLSNEVRLTVTGPDAANSRDTTAPTISSVSMTSDPDENDADLGAYIVGRSGGSIVQSTNWASGVYRIGDDVQVTVTFSENVTVTGSPELELAIGSNNRTAGYESTDGSAVVFSYTVAVGDLDSDGIAVAANKLTLNGGSVKDAANNDADLSHNALTAQAGHEVDGVRPRLKLTVSDRLKFGASSGGTDGAYTTGEELIIRVAFTEGGVRGSVTGRPRVALNFDGGGPRVAKWDPSLIFNPTQYPLVRFFSYVVQEGDLASDGPTIGANAIDLAGGFIRDAAGNDAVLTHSAVAASSSFIVDAVAPTVSSIAITSDPGSDDTYGTGDKIEVTVTFSENMNLPGSITCSPDVVHCEAELELDIGGTARTADYQSHTGADVVYAYTVQAGDTDDNGISIGANKLTGQRIRDAAGRFGYGINDADLSHDAVADDSGHKVSGTS